MTTTSGVRCCYPVACFIKQALARPERLHSVRLHSVRVGG